MDYLVGSADELTEGGRKVVQCGEAEIGVFRVKGKLYAWHNLCSHRQGPICQGRIYHRVIEPVAADGTVRTLQYDEETINIVCPWHGYEFDLTTGEAQGHSRSRLRPAKLREEDGQIYVVL